MNTNILKSVLISFSMILFLAYLTPAQGTMIHSGHKMHSMKDSTGSMHMKMMSKDKCTDMNMGDSVCSKMNMKGMTKEDCIKMHGGESTCSAAETNVIDLNKIDKNKDGKVYQCPMDFDVLSDKPGEDERCGMKLKEVTVKQAKANLIEHGFKVKQ